MSQMPRHTKGYPSGASPTQASCVTHTFLAGSDWAQVVSGSFFTATSVSCKGVRAFNFMCSTDCGFVLLRRRRKSTTLLRSAARFAARLAFCPAHPPDRPLFPDFVPLVMAPTTACLSRCGLQIVLILHQQYVSRESGPTISVCAWLR